MREKNIVKLIKAVDLLGQRSGATIKELQSELRIDRRSVYRLLGTMHEMGFPIDELKTSEFQREKRWRFPEDYLLKLPNISIPQIKLDLSEIIALHLIKGGGRIYRGTEIERKIESAYRKLGVFVPEEPLKNLERVRSLFVATEKLVKDYTDKEEVIEALSEAMLRKNTCQVRYKSFHQDKETSFRIDPLHFFESRGGLYIFVRTTDFKHIRTLAVERILELTPTEEHFLYPVDFDPEQKLAEAFDIVFDDPVYARIWISPGQARYVRERQIPGLQSSTENDNGSLVLEIETSGWWDLKQWILGFGAEAEVLEPTELREEMRVELERACGRYAM